MIEQVALRALQLLMRHRERYLKAWIAATGVHSQDAVLVQKVEHVGSGIKITSFVRRKEDSDEGSASD